MDPETEAIEAGAQDLEAEEDDDGNPAGTSFYTDPTDLDAVRRALEERDPPPAVSGAPAPTSQKIL